MLKNSRTRASPARVPECQRDTPVVMDNACTLVLSCTRIVMPVARQRDEGARELRQSAVFPQVPDR